MWKLFTKKYHSKKIESVDKEKKLLKTNNQKLLKALSAKHKLSAEELKKIWLDNYLLEIETEYKQQLKAKLELAQNEYETKLQNIAISTLSNLNINLVRTEFIVKIQCDNPETKNRLIGLNARNKKCFEKCCGVDLLIDDKSPYISLSSANFIKREIAQRVLTKLIKIKNIEPNKIENLYDEQKTLFEEELYQIGQETVENQLKILGLDKSLYYYVGRLKYRYSYGQNNLEHSLECAFIAEQIAQLFNLDPYIAKMCAFFHDIGKSADHETGLDHVEQGIIIAEKAKLPPEVISAIKTHHEEYITSVYDSITKMADRISAGKPGARKNAKKDFLERTKMYEKICMSFPEVKKCYALKNGFLIRIIVELNNNNFSEDDKHELVFLAHKIKHALEENQDTNQYSLNLEFVQEKIYKLKTQKQNLNN